MKAPAEDFKEACALGNLPVVMEYIKANIDLNHQNVVNGWTALHWAASRDHRNIVEMLLKHGANPDLKDNKERLPADVARGETAVHVFGQQLEAQHQKEIDFIPNYISGIFSFNESSRS